MSLYRFFRISKPSSFQVEEQDRDELYRRLQRNTFCSAAVGYSIFYVCRMTLSVVKQPLIDSGVLSAVQLGVIGSAMLFIYALGKFFNGFMADYCNVHRFMAVGLLVSAIVNLLMGTVSAFTFFVFALLWGVNGWAQSMGSAPGVISLSRWFPLSKRGTMYSIFSSTPYIGKFLSFIALGAIVSASGWRAGFLFSAALGLVGVAIILLFMSDTPESRGLPSVQRQYNEKVSMADQMSTKAIQMHVLRHPGIWVIALSSAFVYIAQYAVSGWGVLFLQKSKDLSLSGASSIMAFSEVFGVLGTIGAGFLSDRVFRGDRAKPVVLCGVLSVLSLALFIFGGSSIALNVAAISLFSLFIGVVYCLVAGLMAIDIVPRKATGAAMGVVGIFSYMAAGVQDIVSGALIQSGSSGEYDFTAVAIFWLVAVVLAFALPSLSWKHLKHGQQQ